MGEGERYRSSMILRTLRRVVRMAIVRFLNRALKALPLRWDQSLRPAVRRSARADGKREILTN